MSTNGELSREAIEEQMRQQRQRGDEQTAAQMASQAVMEMGAAKPGYWDVIGDPDIGREIEDENLADFVATEMSDKFALGNITYGDWQSLQWQIENEFWTLRLEFRDDDCKLDVADMAAMYGETRPKLTDERERRRRSAMQVKKMMTSLSIGARGLRSGTEIHAVAKTENPDTGEEDGGLLSSLKNRLV